MVLASGEEYSFLPGSTLITVTTQGLEALYDGCRVHRLEHGSELIKTQDLTDIIISSDITPIYEA